MSGDPDKKAEVLRLHMIEQMSARAIARQLGMSRKTVGIILGRLPPPSARPPKQPPSSILDPFDDLIRKKLEECPEMKAPAVLEHLRAQGYTGGITILRDRLRAIRPRERKAFLTPHFAPGSAMQVDWGDFGFPLSSTPRRVSALVAVLAYSRVMCLEFTLSQKLGSFLRAMTRAMEFFGGATEADVFDNMKTVVVERHRNNARFHGTFVDFAAHYGFAITACTPRSPHEKGRVERGIPRRRVALLSPVESHSRSSSLQAKMSTLQTLPCSTRSSGSPGSATPVARNTVSHAAKRLGPASQARKGSLCSRSGDEGPITEIVTTAPGGLFVPSASSEGNRGPSISSIPRFRVGRACVAGFWWARRVEGFTFAACQGARASMTPGTSPRPRHLRRAF